MRAKKITEDIIMEGDPESAVIKRIKLDQTGKTIKELVKDLLLTFLEEEPTKTYRYVVEVLSDGRTIYLKRPTRRFNFDFEIWVEKWNRREDYRPSHEDVAQDLIAKRKENPHAFLHLWDAIRKIFEREGEPDAVLQDLQQKGVSFRSGLPLELLLKLLKWMFILEDVYYWNYQRRQRLFNALKRAVFQETLGEHLASGVESTKITNQQR